MNECDHYYEETPEDEFTTTIGLGVILAAVDIIKIVEE